MWSYNYTDELYHYGVPGMKWGVRKRQPSEDYLRTKAIRKKRMKERSNAELTEATNRFNKEKNYREAIRNNREAARKNRPINRVGQSTQRAQKAFVATAGALTAVSAAAVVYAKYGKKAVEGMKKTKKVAEFVKKANKKGVTKGLFGLATKGYELNGEIRKVPVKTILKAAGIAIKNAANS
jgi:hypothetical protein